MKKICLLLAVALALTVMAGAVTQSELEQNEFYNKAPSDIVKDFMAEYDLNGENFAMSYCNTLTGELISYNGDRLMLAASTYKLPLNMLFCDMLADGSLTEDSVIESYVTHRLEDGETLPEGAVVVEQTPAEGEEPVTRYKLPMSGVLSELMEKSLVDSDNDSAEILLRYAYEGKGYSHYLDRIEKYGDFDFSSFDFETLCDNYFPADYMMGCVKYLYEHSNEYTLIIDYLKQAMPGMYFKTYLDCDVAHKYGYLDTACNDVGIIYTNTPFLLVCYTDGCQSGGTVVGRLAELMADYTDYCDDYLEVLTAKQNAEAPEATEETAAEPTEADDEAAQQEAIAQMITEIQGLEMAKPDPTPTPEPTPTPTTEPTPTPEPTPEPTPQPEVKTRLISSDASVIICSAVIIIAAAAVIVVVIKTTPGKRAKKKKRRVRKGKYIPKH